MTFWFFSYSPLKETSWKNEELNKHVKDQLAGCSENGRAECQENGRFNKWCSVPYLILLFAIFILLSNAIVIFSKEPRQKSCYVSLRQKRNVLFFIPGLTLSCNLKKQNILNILMNESNQNKISPTRLNLTVCQLPLS